MKGDFEALSEILSGFLATQSGARGSSARLLAAAWPRVVGAAAAANCQPRSLKGEKLVVATSSAAWAQILQEREGEVLARLTGELGEGVVRAIVFRPAGWDPCAASDAPRALEADPGAWDPTLGEAGGVGAHHRGRARSARRELTAEERNAVEGVRAAAVDDDLGVRIAAAMRASLESFEPDSQPLEGA